MFKKLLKYFWGQKPNNVAEDVVGALVFHDGMQVLGTGESTSWLMDASGREYDLSDIPKPKNNLNDKLNEKKLISQQEIEVLGTYNSEVSRGIIHTDEWKEKMRLLQEAFDGCQQERLKSMEKKFSRSCWPWM